MYQSPAQDSTGQEGNLYAVLNVPRDASQAEINERHRALSLIFHPDKLHGEPQGLKEIATKEFLEIQKAYQVLSDPFLRYTTLWVRYKNYQTLFQKPTETNFYQIGLEGLALRWPASIRSKSKEEIRDTLESANADANRQKLRELVSSKAHLTLSVDASPLFARKNDIDHNDQINVLNRIKRLHIITQHVAYTIQKNLDKKTSISLEVRNSVNRERGSFQFLGTVRHQFSPGLAAWASLNLPGPYITKFGIDYEDVDNSVLARTGFLPFAATNFLAETSITFSRRFWRRQPQRGQVTLQFGRQPSASFAFHSPSPLNVTSEESIPPQLLPPTISGLRHILFDKRIGVIFNSFLPSIFAEASLMFVQLSTHVKCAINYDFVSGITYTLGGQWSGETSEVSTALILNMTGILLQFDFSYLEQRITLPIVLSTEFSPILALGTIVIPSTAAVFGYHFVVVPRRRNQRNTYVQKTLEEESDARRKRDALQSLLKGTAKKQTNLETKRDGLIIENATYGASESEIDGDTSGLFVDVTIPLQALVINSQLHIPGGHTKAALQGFSDPAPFAPKSLCIRYLFRCRVHYAEIPDYLPIVLPLAEHQVNPETACSS